VGPRAVLDGRKISSPPGFDPGPFSPLSVAIPTCASACHIDTTPISHTETPTHDETRTHNQCGDTIEKSQARDDGCINVRNMSSIEEVK